MSYSKPGSCNLPAFMDAVTVLRQHGYIIEPTEEYNMLGRWYKVTPPSGVKESSLLSLSGAIQQMARRLLAKDKNELLG